MDFNTAIEYIHSLDRLDTPQHTHTYAFEHGIARARRLLTRLGGAPNATTRCVLVAGSKGKGSTATMLASVLSAAGYRVGAFTGPHLHTPLERFAIYASARNTQGCVDTQGRVDAKGISAFASPENPGQASSYRDPYSLELMSEAQFVAYAERIARIVETWDRPAQGLPTRFEAFTAIAYRWFEEQATDIAVMEIGIGGRLDAVNLAQPIVSVITNISLEHTQMLGNTLAEIAYAKAGILRPNGDGVIAPQSEEVARVICAEAECIGSRGRLRFVNDCCRLECAGVHIAAGLGASGQWLRMHRAANCFSPFDDAADAQSPLFLSLLGHYQLENAATAITAAEALRARGFKIDFGSLQAGLSRVRWPGRFQVLLLDPTVIADGAHTPYSMERLCDSLQAYFPDQRIHFIIGTLRDKDSRGIIQAAANAATSLTFTDMDVRRATPASQLYEIWQALSTSRPQNHPQCREFRVSADDAQTAVDLSSAFRQVLGRAQPDDVICIAGSLHLAALAEEQILNSQGASLE